MSSAGQPPVPDNYESALSALGVAALTVLTGFEHCQRNLHPPEIPALRDRMRPHHEHLGETLGAFRAAEPPSSLSAFHDLFAEGAQHTLEATSLFLADATGEQGFVKILGSMREMCRALESFYALHRLPPLSRYFVEAPWHEDLEALDPPTPEGLTLGLHQAGGEGGGADRGGFALYVPERYDGSRALPLVVALHGGSGNGRDFIWTWLREARGREFILLAPTARGQTWSMDGPDVDAPAIRRMVEWVSERWRVDGERVLLTGLSDGATYSLLLGLAENSPFTALAPASGVLHPVNLANGNLERAAGKRIYLVHGALDWMFPVDIARMAHERLREAGANIVFREIADLSHTYARDENDKILTWFDPALALPENKGSGETPNGAKEKETTE